MNDVTILIVEDEAIVAADLAGKLGQLGYHVAGTAAEGEQAVEMACRLQPRVVLIDIWLKGTMDGIDAAEAIRRRIDVPVIYLTAHSDSATLERAKLSEPFGYILKSFEERELSTAIEMALNKHQSEKQLREQHEWLQVTLASIGDAVITCDTDGRVTYLNPVAEALTGWSASEARECSIREVFPLISEETRRPPEDPVALVLREGRTKTLTNHTALVTRDGREIPIEDSAAPILDVNGRVIGVVLVFHDVTEKRRAEDALRKSHEELELRVAKRTRELKDLNDTLEERIIERTSQLNAANETLRASRRAALNLMEDAVVARKYAEETSNRLRLEISERERAEELLRESEERLRLFIEYAPAGLAMFDRDMRYLFSSRRWRNDFNLGERELSGVSHYEVFPEISDAWKEVHRRGMAGEVLREEADRFDRADGSVQWVRWEVRPWRDSAGAIGGIVIFSEDITRSKQAEESLRESEQWFRMAQQAAKAGTWQWDLATGKNLWSEELWKLYGLKPNSTEPSYETWLRIVHPDDRAMAEHVVREAAQSGTELNVEFRVVHADHSEHWLMSRGKPVHDESGRTVRYLGIILDITERKRAEEALQTSSRYSSLLAETTAQLLSSDSPQRVVDDLCRRVMEALDCQAFFNFLVDEQAGRLRLNACSGIPEEEVKLLEWLDYGVAVCGCAARDATRIVAQDIPNTPDPRTDLVKSYGIRAYACHPLLAQGRVLGTISFGTRNRPGFTGDELALMKAVADHVAIAMERKQAEEELNRAREAAEAASRAKSQFLANMSHELRSPMAGVLGMLELALDTPLDREQRENISLAHASASSLMGIINDILDLTRIEAGKLSITESPFDLHECLADTVKLFVPESRRKGLDISWSIESSVPRVMLGDQVRLRQVLTNLIGNAVKFTGQGTVRARIMAGAGSAGKREVTFTVTDTGIGIPADKRDILFNPFSQVDESHTRRFGGTGLGLAISKELVERMGGSITFESTEGIGSTFMFTVPLGEADSWNDAVPQPAAATSAQSVSATLPESFKPRILVAEDDEVIRQLLVKYLRKRSNFDIELAVDGRQAVEMWERDVYDLILMDVQMPELDGFEATSIIRDKEKPGGRHTIIIAVTGHALKDDEERCFAAGMDAYISKPIHLKSCLELMKSLIEQKKTELRE